jgi:hypothetical protein
VFKATGWDASGVFRAQAATLTIATRGRAKTEGFFFTDCPIKDLLIEATIFIIFAP